MYAGYSGTAGDSLAYYKQKNFSSTKDNLKFTVFNCSTMLIMVHTGITLAHIQI